MVVTGIDIVGPLGKLEDGILLQGLVFELKYWYTNTKRWYYDLNEMVF